MVNKHPVYFKVEYYDNGHKFHTGFIFSKDFTDAMRQLEDYYGNDLMVIHHLELFEEGPLLVPEQTCQEICRGAYEIN